MAHFFVSFCQSIWIDPVTATDIANDATTVVVVVLYTPIYLERLSYVMYFGDDAVDLGFTSTWLTPQELVRCAKICRLMRTNMPRVASYLRHYRDMTKQMLMGGEGCENRVDLLDVIEKKKKVRGKKIIAGSVVRHYFIIDIILQ